MKTSAIAALVASLTFLSNAIAAVGANKPATTVELNSPTIGAATPTALGADADDEGEGRHHRHHHHRGHHHRHHRIPEPTPLPPKRAPMPPVHLPPTTLPRVPALKSRPAGSPSPKPVSKALQWAPTPAGHSAAAKAQTYGQPRPAGVRTNGALAGLKALAWSKSWGGGNAEAVVGKNGRKR